MKQVVEGVTNPHPSWKHVRKNFWGTAKAVSPCTWHGILCDARHEIREVKWDYRHLERTLQGNFSFLWLPETLLRLHLSVHLLGGELDLSSLPQAAMTYRLKRNLFTGEINLTQLPPILKALSAQHNRLTGLVDLNYLPEGFLSLNLSYNRIRGTADLTHLPRGIRKLSLKTTEISSLNYPDARPSAAFVADLTGNLIKEAKGNKQSFVRI